MTPKRRLLVWLDHHEARLIHPLPGNSEFEVTVVTGDHGATHERKHDGGHRHAISAHFSDAIATAARDYTEVVIAGPSTAKEELMKLLRERHHALAERVAQVEPLERATDPQLAAHARVIFERIDRMRGAHVV